MLQCSSPTITKGFIARVVNAQFQCLKPEAMKPCQPCGSCRAWVAFHGVVPNNANAEYHRRQLRSRSGLQHPCVAPTRALSRASRVTGNFKCPKSSSTVTECPSFVAVKAVSCCKEAVVMPQMLPFLHNNSNKLCPPPNRRQTLCLQTKLLHTCMALLALELREHWTSLLPGISLLCVCHHRYSHIDHRDKPICT